MDNLSTPLSLNTTHKIPSETIVFNKNRKAIFPNNFKEFTSGNKLLEESDLKKESNGS